MDFDPESYQIRMDAFLDFIKRQNEQQKREDAWVSSQNPNGTLKPKKKLKSKAQVRKEQLQKQVPKLTKVNKFFNFY